MQQIFGESFLLTEGLATLAVQCELPSILKMMELGITNRKDLHIVVLKPGVPYDSDISLKSGILYEYSIREAGKWEAPYDLFARGKARVTWRTGLPSHYVQQFARHLYQRGDVVHAGSAILEGIVVGCSGVQGHFDRLFAEKIAATCRALSYDAFDTWKKNNPGVSFFPTE